MAQRFTLDFDCGNDDFGPTPVDRAITVSRILSDLACGIRRDCEINPFGVLRDGNGNRIGGYRLIED